MGIECGKFGLGSFMCYGMIRGYVDGSNRFSSGVSGREPAYLLHFDPSAESAEVHYPASLKRLTICWSSAADLASSDAACSV
jgi:hypothetical protein